MEPIHQLFAIVKGHAWTLLATVVIPLVTGVVSPISAIDQVFLGGLVFAIGILVQIGSDLRQLHTDTAELRTKQIALHKAWTAHNALEMQLGNISSHFAMLNTRPSTLYTRYFEAKLKALEASMKESVSSGDLVVDQDADTTEMMLLDFGGKPEHVIRAVHFLEDSDYFLSVHASHFFSDVAAGVKGRRITAVRRLFIVSEDHELESAMARKLLAFHRHTDGFEYRLIRNGNYLRLRKDFNLATETKDFAVYGDWFLYRTMKAVEGEARGIFSANPEVVSRYRGAFDKCFNSSFSYSLDSDLGLAPTLAELFGIDPVSPNRPGVAKQVVGTALHAPEVAAPKEKSSPRRKDPGKPL